jgi:hypothetical protein
MDESALTRALDSLDSCTSSLHGWLRFWTLLVVVGVALEIIFVVWEYVEERRDRRTCLIIPPVKPHLPLFILGFVGAGLVTAGVAGELNVEPRIARVETCIRKGNGQLFLLLSTEAGDAKTSAKEAAQASGVAKDKADFVAREAERLRKEVVELSPRNLTLKQQRQIADALRPIRVYPTVIESYGMDGEGTALATQLISTLGASGHGTPGDWRASKVVSGGFEWGISIRGPADAMSYMTALRGALVNIGRLKQVSINGPVPSPGAVLSGNVIASGQTIISGRSGSPVQMPIPTTGPVHVFVGVRPPPVLP